MADELRPCVNCGEPIPVDSEVCRFCGDLKVSAECDYHAGREATSACVVCGRALCGEDEVVRYGLHLCPEHADLSLIEGWAQVYSTSSDIEAELVRENLAADGIDARILSQKDHFSFTVDLGNLSPVRVLVPAFAYEVATRVIREHMDEHGGVAFACANCGEAYDPGERRCSACGNPLP